MSLVPHTKEFLWNFSEGGNITIRYFLRHEYKIKKELLLFKIYRFLRMLFCFTMCLTTNFIDSTTRIRVQSTLTKNRKTSILQLIGSDR